MDTENVFDHKRAAERCSFPPLADFLPVFERCMGDKAEKCADTPINRIRSEVLHQCVQRASDSPCIYILTFPTGGGKTLSSLAFAWLHSATHSKERVIYVIPYTSNLELSANQFRDIFGNAVIEHNSHLDLADENKETAQSRLVCENWANRTSRCRKLNRIIDSVVVRDKAQLLPPEFVTPILHVLTELTKHYGVTVLLTTATQPAFLPRPEQRSAELPHANGIIADPGALHNQLKRTQLVVPESLQEPRSWENLARELTGHRSVRYIVNRRDDARPLWKLMPQDTFHQLALMYGQHRQKYSRPSSKASGTACRPVSSVLSWRRRSRP